MDKVKKINNSLLVLNYITVTGAIFIFAFLLLRFPDYAGRGVKKGLELCMYTLIPSMYPFMFLSCFVISSGLCEKSEKVFSFITEKVFGLPGVCGSLILLSMVGGLPIGGKMTAEMYEKGYITKEQGQRLLLFCINPGPAFVITGVGYYMLGSEKAGYVIFASLILSSLTIGFLSRFVFFQNEIIPLKKYESKTLNLQHSAVSSVTDSGRGMLTVCAWVLLFSCISGLTELLPLSEGMRTLLSSVLEITTGCENAAGRVPIPVLSGIIGFSGVCAHLQIMPAIVKMKLPIKYFLSARVINAAFAIIFSMVLFELFPLSVQTISMGSLPQHIDKDISVPVCIGVMFMCILLLLGENYRIKNTVKKIFKNNNSQCK